MAPLEEIYKCINEGTDEEESVKRYPELKLQYTVIVSIASMKSLQIFDKYDDLNKEDDFTQMYYNDTKFKMYYTILVKTFYEILKNDYGYNLEEFDSPGYRFCRRFCEAPNFEDESLIPMGNPLCDIRMMLCNPTFTQYPVHLDYKIANVFGSFPRIYKHCRCVEPNKSFMKETIDFFFKSQHIQLN